MFAWHFLKNGQYVGQQSWHTADHQSGEMSSIVCHMGRVDSLSELCLPIDPLIVSCTMSSLFSLN